LIFVEYNLFLTVNSQFDFTVVWYSHLNGELVDDWSFLQWLMLCYRYISYVMDSVHTPGTGPIWLDEVQCKGHETHFDQCHHGPWGSHNCSHQDDVSISCYARTTTVTPTATTTSTSTVTTTTSTTATRTTTQTTTTASSPGNLSRMI